MRDKGKLIYRVRRATEHGYTADSLWIAEYDEESATTRLAGTVENRAGYGSGEDPVKRAEIAARMGRVFAAMLDAKIETFYDYGYNDHSFSIGFQVYANPEAPRPDYCHPRLDFPSSVAGARWAMKLIEKVGRKVERTKAKAHSAERGYDCEPRDVGDHSIEQLQDVTIALDQIGAVRVEDWIGPSEGWYSPPRYFVAAK